MKRQANKRNGKRKPRAKASRKQPVKSTAVAFLQPKRYTNLQPPQYGTRAKTHSAICSIIDPFCIHARGAQYPDGTGGPTIPMQLRGITTAAADGTTGTGAVVFVPNPQYPKLDAASHVGSTWTWNSSSGTPPLSNSFFTSNAFEVRIVSWGVVVRSQMTASTAKGSMIIQTLTQPPYSGTYTSGTINTPYAQVHALSANTEVCWISQPLGPTARNFRPLSAYVNNLSDLDWTGLQIEVINSDTTTNIPLLSIEVVMNVEFNLLANNGLNQVARPPPTQNKVAVTAANFALSKMSPYVEGGIQAAGRYLENIALGALKSLLPAPLRTAAAIMDVD